MEGMSLKAVTRRMQIESRKHQKQVAIYSVIFGVLAVILSGLWIARLDSVMKAQTRYEDVTGVTESIVIYDVSCYVGPFSHDQRAEEKAEEARDCLLDQSCRDLGSNWSSVYLTNAIVCVALVANMICVGFGSCIPVCRLTGAWCASFLCLAHFAVIVMTGIYRYSSMGVLCSLATGSSNITSDSVSDDWTYEKDGRLMVFLFVIQLLTFVCFWIQGIHGVRPLKSTPKHQTDEQLQTAGGTSSAFNPVSNTDISAMYTLNANHDVTTEKK